MPAPLYQAHVPLVLSDVLFAAISSSLDPRLRWVATEASFVAPFEPMVKAPLTISLRPIHGATFTVPQ